jgi:hypothetical protein
MVSELPARSSIRLDVASMMVWAHAWQVNMVGMSLELDSLALMIGAEHEPFGAEAMATSERAHILTFACMAALGSEVRPRSRAVFLAVLDAMHRATYDHCAAIMRWYGKATRTAMGSPPPLSVLGLAHGSRLFKFGHELPIALAEAGGLWIASCEPLGIFSPGATPRSAFGEFAAEFVATYDTIARERDARLTLDARDLKRRLRALVQRVQKVPA